MSQPSVLIVDGDQDAALSLHELLKIRGYDVRVTLDTTTAMVAAAQRRPDAILLDIGAGGDITGVDLCRWLRRGADGGKALIIVITGWTRAEDQANARAAGCDHYLLKPVDLQTLETLLQGPGLDS
jgi:DNA-binding response OmpR family regulator